MNEIGFKPTGDLAADRILTEVARWITPEQFKFGDTSTIVDAVMKELRVVSSD